MKKIIEEQQRLSGSPGVGSIPPPTSTELSPESDKTDPSTPAPTSESPLQDKPIRDVDELFNGHSRNKSVSSLHEPLTPDSSGRNGSPFESPKSEPPNKRQQVEGEQGHAKRAFIFPHQILESSSGSGFQHPGLMFPMGGARFDLPAVGDGLRFGDGLGSEL